MPNAVSVSQKNLMMCMCKLFCAMILIAVCALGCAASKLKETPLAQDLAELELSAGGKIGISAQNGRNGQQFQYHADDRFPFCSTFKVILAAAILARSTQELDFLNKNVPIAKDEVERAGYAPVTSLRYETGMSVNELCIAAIQRSDNGAANLLMKELGGPKAVTEYARRIGDPVFNLVRWEPELNSASPDDARDTTTPNAMQATLNQLLNGKVLPISERNRLRSWLDGNTTGDNRIKAGLPSGWRVGDKTGTCAYGTTNDVGVITSPDNESITIAIFFTQTKKEAKAREDIIASATRLLLKQSR